MRYAFLSLAGAFLYGIGLFAQTPEATIDGHVQKLANPRYAVREQATKELEKLGEPALKSLKLAMNSRDEELRERATKLVQKIEQRLRTERLLQAPKMSLAFDETPLDSAVVELSRKTGFTFQLDSSSVKNPKRPVTLKLQDVPYWQAIHEFYRVAGITENDDPPAETKGGRRDRDPLIYRSPSGPMPMNLIRLKDGELTSYAVTDRSMRVWICTKHPSNKYDDNKGEVQLQVKVDAVPALNTQDIIGVDLRKAVDENQRVLTLARPEMPLTQNDYEEVIIINGRQLGYSSFGGLFSRYQPLALRSEGIRPKQLSELHGVVVASVLTPPEPILTINDVVNDKAVRVGRDTGLRCEVTGTRKSVTGSLILAVKMEMELMEETLDMPVQIRGRMRPFIRVQRASGELGSGLPKVIIRDQTGKVHKHAVIKMDGSGDGLRMTYQIELRMEQPNDGDQLSLTLEARRPATIEMPFSFKNVPMP